MPIKLGSVEVGIDNPPIDTKTYGRKDGEWIDLASAAALQFRQGTNADRLAMDPVPASGEPIYATDNYRLFIGDGTTTGGRGLVGDTTSYVICQPGDSLPDKYAAAKNLQPGGSALSATNRGALIILPGKYALTSNAITFDGEYVDVIGLGSAQWKAVVFLTGTVTVDADDINVVGIDVSGNLSATSGGAARTLLNCVSNGSMYLRTEDISAGVVPVYGGTLIGCRTRGFQISGSICSAGNVLNVFNGSIFNCRASGEFLGGDGVFQGEIRNCTSEATGFGSFTSGFQGLVEWCRFALRLIDRQDPSSQAAFGSTCTISNASPAVVTENGHELLTGMRIQFSTDGALPTGLNTTTVYYVKVIDANTFEVSTTLNGSSVNTSSAGSGTHTIEKPGKQGGWYSYCSFSDGDYTST